MNAPMFTHMLLDAFHGDTLNVSLLANNGPVAIILKATQGTSYNDPVYAVRRHEARANGMLTGSYHFGTGEDPVMQAHHWLNIAMPEDDEVLEFDWERNFGGSTMTYAQACAFVAEVRKRAGRYPLIYGSEFLKEHIPAGDSILHKCPLSLASYNTKPELPAGWDYYTIWQYTGDDANARMGPHTFPGADNPVDVYQFDGTIAELKAAWPFKAV